MLDFAMCQAAIDFFTAFAAIMGITLGGFIGFTFGVVVTLRRNRSRKPS